MRLEIDAPAELSAGQEIGMIESKKAESSLFAPISGNLPRFNQELISDPSNINVDKYGDGWLFDMLGQGEELKTPVEYIKQLGEVWEVTQRTIKGQLN